MREPIFVTRSSMPPYEEYAEAIRPLWDSHQLTNMGVYHKKFEKELENYLGIEHVSLMTNGHMALELAIQAMGFSEGSEVITTPFTFISTTHAIVRNRLKPVFCDVKPEDGTIDENRIESLITEKTVAIVPVHVYGNVCNVEQIEEIAFKYGLKVIYDAAHAFGVKYKGKGIATFGDASCFSFHATKVFNTIEGGAVAFHDSKLYEKLYNLKNFGIRGQELVVEVGANAKMNEFCAIMGLCNLKHVSQNTELRKYAVGLYKKLLKNIPGINFLHKESTDIISNYAYFPIVINRDLYGATRDGLYDFLQENNVYSRKYFYPLTLDQACFKNKYKGIQLLIGREIAENVLVLPLYADMSENNIQVIATLIEQFYKKEST